MALYEVSRTDEVRPGEFVSAYVLAGGAGLARRRVKHLTGVLKDATNLRVVKIDVGNTDLLLSVYFDERATS